MYTDYQLLNEAAIKGADYDAMAASKDRELSLCDSTSDAKDIQFVACAAAGHKVGALLIECNTDLLKSEEKHKRVRLWAGGATLAAVLVTILYVLK